MNTINHSTYSPVQYAAPDIAERAVPDNGAAALKTAAVLDTYQRADGSVSTRLDAIKPDAVKAVSHENLETFGEETPKQAEDKKFRELLHQFVGQTLFGLMLKSMRATQEKNPYFHGGRAEEIFQGQLDMQLTDEMTKASSKTLSEPMFNLMTAKKTM